MPSLVSNFEPDTLQPQWKEAPSQPRLAAGEAHIWRAHLDGGNAAALHFFRRDVLSRYGLYPETLQLLPECLRLLRVGSTHAEGLALLGVTISGNLALEVEMVRQDVPFDDLMQEFLDPEHLWSVRLARNPRQKATRFFECWTSQEAALRAGSDPRTASGVTRNFCPATGFTAAVACTAGGASFAFWDWAKRPPETRED